MYQLQEVEGRSGAQVVGSAGINPPRCPGAAARSQHLLVPDTRPLFALARARSLQASAAHTSRSSRTRLTYRYHFNHLRMLFYDNAIYCNGFFALPMILAASRVEIHMVFDYLFATDLFLTSVNCMVSTSNCLFKCTQIL